MLFFFICCLFVVAAFWNAYFEIRLAALASLQVPPVLSAMTHTPEEVMAQFTIEHETARFRRKRTTQVPRPLWSSRTRHLSPFLSHLMNFALFASAGAQATIDGRGADCQGGFVTSPIPFALLFLPPDI